MAKPEAVSSQPKSDTPKDLTAAQLLTISKTLANASKSARMAAADPTQRKLAVAEIKSALSTTVERLAFVTVPSASN